MSLAVPKVSVESDSAIQYDTLLILQRNLIFHMVTHVRFTIVVVVFVIIIVIIITSKKWL